MNLSNEGHLDPINQQLIEQFLVNDLIISEIAIKISNLIFSFLFNQNVGKKKKKKTFLIIKDKSFKAVFLS